MKSGNKISIVADSSSLRAIARLALAAAAGALQWGCMETSSPGATQAQAMAVRSESANPMCRTQTHLLILDQDVIANGSHCRAVIPDNGNSCRKDDDKSKDRDDDDDSRKDGEKDNHSRETVEKNKSKGGAGGHGGRGGSGGFNEASAGPGGGGAGGSGHGDDSDHGKRNDKDDDQDDGKDEGKDGDKDKVTICHNPPGNHENAKTICVGSPAVKAHLAHGDKLGKCEDIPVSGSCEKSFVGNRATLLAYANMVGKEVTLPSGTIGDEGWFAITTIRIGWKSAGPEVGDGLRNYFEAGPGLGGADAKGNKETLLDKVPDLTPLRATGLARLEGRSVCAVVLDGDVKMSYNPRVGDIRGPNLGKIAFQVLSVVDSRGANALPSVRVRILDAEAVCNDPLSPYLDAPAPTSISEPPDIDRPSCAIQENLVTEPWNALDTTVWRGDGDQMVEGGLFFARDGASSATADWISPCPIGLDTNTTVKFSNRINLNSPGQNEFAESGALFLVNAGPDGTYDNYVFVNVGYTMSPSKVFVELFGSDGGTDFDQYEETNLPFTPSQLFNVDLWILPNAYHVAVAEEMIDTVTLASPINTLSLFEVGVQQNGGGLRGLIDMTTISKLCIHENKIQRCKRHTVHRGCKKQRLGSNHRCRTRNDYIRVAKERIKHCPHPTRSMQILCKLKERPDFD